jgi:cytochrome c oxidase assembly protein subunit 15
METNQSKESGVPLKRRALHAFAILTGLVTFVLLTSGGLVTSKGVGMAVPDWPSTFGYNMFLFPISGWVGGVFYEHTHRLLGSLVGLMTLILAGWIFTVDPRRWMRVLSIVAVFGVILQGILGGLRVTLITNEIGIFHGTLGQSFLLTIAVIVVATSSKFILAGDSKRFRAGALKALAVGLVATIFIQLGIAATMRHAHLGLSIPDFPLAYGQVIPTTDAATIVSINASRVDQGKMPTTATQIWLQMKHRIIAVLILGLSLALAISAWRRLECPRDVKIMAVVILVLVLCQIGLGAWTIWSDKAADVATAHQALGAIILMTCGLTTFRIFRLDYFARQHELEFPTRIAWQGNAVEAR